MSRADKRPSPDLMPPRRRVEAVIAQYIYDLAAEAGASNR
jgi:hypothetical protein